MTPAEIIYQRRVRLLDLAREAGNVAEACRSFGVSRTRYYEWKSLAERYGLEARIITGERHHRPVASEQYAVKTESVDGVPHEWLEIGFSNAGLEILSAYKNCA